MLAARQALGSRQLWTRLWVSFDHPSREAVDGHGVPASTMMSATDSAGRMLFLHSGASRLFRDDTGNVNENLLPLGSRRVAQIRPTCRVTGSLQMYKPTPRPLRLA